MKKKIRADSVDELFEIVKAIQNGEEPEAYTKRKAAEKAAAQKAAAEEAEERRRAEKAAAQKAAEEKKAARRAAAGKTGEHREIDKSAAQRAAAGIAEGHPAAEESPAQKTAAEKAGEYRTAEKGAAQRAVSGKKNSWLRNENREDDEEFERLLDEDEDNNLEESAGKIAEWLTETGRFLKKTVHEGVQSGREKLEETAHRISESAGKPAEKHSEKSAVKQSEERLGTPAGKQSEAGSLKSIGKQSEAGSLKSIGKQTEAGASKPVGKQTEAGASVSGRQEPAQPTQSEENKKVSGKTKRHYGAKAVSEEAETVGRRILRSLHMEHPEEKQKESSGERRAETALQTEPAANSPAEPKTAEKSSIPAESKSAERPSVPAESKPAGKPSVPAESKPAEKSSIPAESKPAETPSVPAESKPAEKSSVQAERNTGMTAEPEEKAEASAKLDPRVESLLHPETVMEDSVRPERLSDHKETPRAPDVKSCIHRFFSRLEEKGFGKKKLAAAGTAAVAAVLVILLVIGAVRLSLGNQKKQKYVTADAGLTVLVENQPEEWCNSCELILQIKVKKGTVSSITVNGTVYETDAKGYITAEVADTSVEVIAVTDEETLTAQIEIPKLDTDAPTLSVDKSQGEISVSAADSRSGVAGIWYAVVDEEDWLQLPLYQQYSESEPIVWEEGKLYYFYATDQAGNASSPLVTNMVTAESVSLSDTELTMLEGDTAQLSVDVTPSNALLTNLSYKSSNTDVVTVTSSGLVTAVGVGGALIKATADDLTEVSCQVTVAEEQTVTISAIGDCTLGTYAGFAGSNSFDTYYAMYGATWFFENVRDILENDDLTFANLEGTLTDETTPEDKTYAFKGDPSYTEILQDGSIEVVTLANNHSSDYGAQSLEDTKTNLTEAGIEYCIGNTIAYEEVSGIKIAFIGIYELASGMDCEAQVRETIAEAQDEDAQLIIIAFHWGTEKETAADETQQALAHIAVDCGADLVVGHHPHVLQGIEKYNGKYIVYSLGNFCFGGNSNPSDKDTMIFRQTFTITADGVALDDDIEIIPCTLSSESGYNDYRPTPATGSDADAIMERINEYSAAFGTITYTASTGL